MVSNGPSNSDVDRFPLDEKGEGTGNSQQWEETVQHIHQACVADWQPGTPVPSTARDQ